MEFCKSYLAVNSDAFCDPRLELIINDARLNTFFNHICFVINKIQRINVNFNYFVFRAELEKREDKYDVIIGDLADPLEGGPCYQLYTKTFYELTVKPKLKEGGIFVTQVYFFY